MAELAQNKEDFSHVLTEEILNVDKQLLQVEKLTNEVFLHFLIDNLF